MSRIFRRGGLEGETRSDAHLNEYKLAGTIERRNKAWSGILEIIFLKRDFQASGGQENKNVYSARAGIPRPLHPVDTCVNTHVRVAHEPSLLYLPIDFQETVILMQVQR